MSYTVGKSASEALPSQEGVHEALPKWESIRKMFPSRNFLVMLALMMIALMLLTSLGAAQTNNSLNPSGTQQNELVNTLQGIGTFVSLIILGVAVPNGAYGFLQYMTSGSNVDQDEKGRTRIRNTFIGLAGVAVIQIGVEVFTSVLT